MPEVPLYELVYDEHCPGWRDWRPTPVIRETDWFLTRMFARHMVRIGDDDWEMWTVVEVARSGEFLAYRSRDEAGRWEYSDFSKGEGGFVVGCNHHRWFPGEVLIGEIQERWER